MWQGVLLEKAAELSILSDTAVVQDRLRLYKEVLIEIKKLPDSNDAFTFTQDYIYTVIVDMNTIILYMDNELPTQVRPTLYLRSLNICVAHLRAARDELRVAYDMNSGDSAETRRSFYQSLTRCLTPLKKAIGQFKI
jgi:hypothetical protein